MAPSRSTPTRRVRPERALSELTTQLDKTRHAIEARIVLAADASGNLVQLSEAHHSVDAATLAALGAANLAATQAMTYLTRMLMDTQAPQTFIIEGAYGCIVLCGYPDEIVFMAVLSENSVLGLSRLEMRKLAEIIWVDTTPTTDAQPLAAAELAQQFLDSLDDIL